MAVAPCEALVAAQDTHDRHRQGGERLPEHGLVAVAPDPVEDHAGETDRWIEAPEAVHQGGDGPAEGGRVHDEHDRCVDQTRHVGGAGRAAVLRSAVEEAHHTLHDEHVRPLARSRGERRHRVGPRDPGVQVAGRASRGEPVVAGVDEVGAHLRRRHGEPPACQGRHDPGGDGGLAHAGVGAGDHESGPERDHSRSERRTEDSRRQGAGRAPGPGTTSTTGTGATTATSGGRRAESRRASRSRSEQHGPDQYSMPFLAVIPRS